MSDANIVDEIVKQARTLNGDQLYEVFGYLSAMVSELEEKNQARAGQ